MLYICILNRFIMESIRLEFQPNIRAKIMEVLSSFSSDELKIIKVGEILLGIIVFVKLI